MARSEGSAGHGRLRLFLPRVNNLMADPAMAAIVKLDVASAHVQPVVILRGYQRPLPPICVTAWSIVIVPIVLAGCSEGD